MEKSLFTCPICAAPLERGERAYACPNGHAYDKAREGYVHLLPANKKHSKAPGDDRGMAEARRRFLSGDTTATCWPPCAPWGGVRPAGGGGAGLGLRRGVLHRRTVGGPRPPAPGGNRPVRRRCAWPPGGCRRGVRRGLRLPSASGGCLGGAGAQLLPPWPWTSSGGCSAPAGPSSMWCPPPTTCGSSSRCSTTSPTATRRRTPLRGLFLRAGGAGGGGGGRGGEAARPVPDDPYYWKTPGGGGAAGRPGRSAGTGLLPRPCSGAGRGRTLAGFYVLCVQL